MNKEKMREEYLSILFEAEKHFKNTGYVEMFLEAQTLICDIATAKAVDEELNQDNINRLEEIEAEMIKDFNEEDLKSYNSVKFTYPKLIKIGITEEFDLSEEN